MSHPGPARAFPRVRGPIPGHRGNLVRRPAPRTPSVSAGSFSPSVISSVDKTLGQVTARVCRPEHLMAILVQTGRAKDHARLQMFLEEAEFDRALFEALIDRFGLRERWTAWTS
jgi:hypothetical protein